MWHFNLLTSVAYTLIAIVALLIDLFTIGRGRPVVDLEEKKDDEIVHYF
jgi:hypothetical protein